MNNLHHKNSCNNLMWSIGILLLRRKNKKQYLKYLSLLYRILVNYKKIDMKMKDNWLQNNKRYHNLSIPIKNVYI